MILTSRGTRHGLVRSIHELRTWISEGFDSSGLLILRGGTPRSMGGDFTETWSRRFSVCRFLVCGLTVAPRDPSATPPRLPASFATPRRPPKAPWNPPCTCSNRNNSNSNDTNTNYHINTNHVNTTTITTTTTTNNNNNHDDNDNDNDNGTNNIKLIILMLLLIVGLRTDRERRGPGKCAA